jgi:phosphoglycerol transferase MdoB-like AlkP superfamily enzyme
MEQKMTRYIYRWTALLGWTALMAIVWALFVPRGLSATTFTLLSLTGPLVLVAGSALWRAQRPALSVRQIRAALDSEKNAETPVRGQR